MSHPLSAPASPESQADLFVKPENPGELPWAAESREPSPNDPPPSDPDPNGDPAPEPDPRDAEIAHLRSTVDRILRTAPAPSAPAVPEAPTSVELPPLPDLQTEPEKAKDWLQQTAQRIATQAETKAAALVRSAEQRAAREILWRDYTVRHPEHTELRGIAAQVATELGYTDLPAPGQEAAFFEAVSQGVSKRLERMGWRRDAGQPPPTSTRSPARAASVSAGSQARPTASRAKPEKDENKPVSLSEQLTELQEASGLW